MPPRSRKPENKDLEPNVYAQVKGEHTYYFYVHPIDHWTEQLGKDKSAANRTGRALNQALHRSGIDPTKRAPVIKGQTTSQIIDEWLPIKLAKLKPGISQKNMTNFTNRVRELFKGRPIRALTVREISDSLAPLNDNSYIKMRQILIEVFDFALSRGYLPHNYGNPAKVTERRSEPKRVRRRLTLDEFKAVYDEAPKWLQVAMGIFLHTGLRPGDIVNMKFTQFEAGSIKTRTQKTGKALKLSLNENAQKIIKGARDDIASPYIVHRMPKRKGQKMSGLKDHPTQLTVDELSRTFREIRNRLGITGEGAPSFYEIRSLASRTYEDEGYDIKTIQALLAHTNEKMTAKYLENEQEVVYVEVQAGLKVDLS